MKVIIFMILNFQQDKFLKKHVKLLFSILLKNYNKKINNKKLNNKLKKNQMKKTLQQ